jgi:hypothetical protein
MNLFVIMPFAREFDDVYFAIKRSVEEAVAGTQLNCFRLDESRVAGRITQRLMEELGAASLCVADLTGLRPNVMWEVGYAMALGKPTIIVTQDNEELPFDIHDMHSICYDRGHLGETLGKPLARSVIDTLSAVRPANPQVSAQSAERDRFVGGLLDEVRGLKDLLSQTVKAWNPPGTASPPSAGADLGGLEGAWYDAESGSHHYARVIGGELVVPYCFGGDNCLKAAYYGWRRIGQYWFARYQWLDSPLSGFAFFRHESLDMLAGAWWLNDGVREVPEMPEMGSGVATTLTRLPGVLVPPWADRFFEDVRREGLVTRLARRTRPRP